MAKILIVDNDIKVSKQVMQLLSAEGHKCYCETFGSGAFDKIKRAKYDLIILDVMLPDLSGFEVCRQLRRDNELFKIPILIFSEMSSEEEIEHILAQGADDFISKSTGLPVLTQRVEALLNARLGKSDIDGLTSLANGDTIKREVQRMLSLKSPFALAYIELLDLREFAKVADASARAKAIRHLARLIARSCDQLKGDAHAVGHMGGGHFVSLLPNEDAHRLCRYIRAMWMKHIPELCSMVGYDKFVIDVSQENGQSRLLDLQICITFFEGNTIMSCRQMFEVLSRIRNKVINNNVGGIYLDERHGNHKDK